MLYLVKMNSMEKNVLLGEKYCEQLSPAIKNLGYNIIPVPDNPDIDPRLSGHADLSLFYDNCGTIFAAEYLKQSEFLTKIKDFRFNIQFIGEKQNKKYPKDAQLNVCQLGDKFIYNPKTASPALVCHLEKQGREGIACRQGYSRCSICVVNDNSLITSDSGIAKICREHDIDVLEISPGHIALDGFDYGFIGGTSIKLSDGLIAFTGSLAKHPQNNEIIAFIESKGEKIIFLTDCPAFDIGSAHVIM